MSIIDKLQSDCDYNPDGEGSVDNLIAYKDVLEDLVGRVDDLLLCNSGHPDAEREREQRDLATLSAADVCGALFGMGFGDAPAKVAPVAKPDLDDYDGFMR